MDERTLVEKLRRVEALFAGAKTDGESAAAASAMERIRRLLDEASKADPPEEYTFTMQNPWSMRLFLALLRRYGVAPYRYRRQRRTTVMARVSKRFVDKTLWPEFREIDDLLQRHIDEVTRRIIAEAIWSDASDAEERPEMAKLADSQIA